MTPILGSLLACAPDDGPVAPVDDSALPTATLPPPLPLAWMRAAHAGVALGPVDFWIDGTVRPTFPAATPPGGGRFRGTDPGTRRVWLVAPGAPETAVLAETTVEIADGGHYALVASGSASDPRVAVFDEDASDVPVGSARYTLFSALDRPVSAGFGGDAWAVAAGTRVILGDGPTSGAALTLALGGPTDCTFALPAAPAATVVACYLVDGDDGPALYAHVAGHPFEALPGAPEGCGEGG